MTLQQKLIVDTLPAVSPDRALCLPTFSHFVIVNKTPLSLSLSLSVCLSLLPSLSLVLEVLWSLFLLPNRIVKTRGGGEE